MKWEKFRKERISLNYTVMLLPHSEKKPIHFKTPVWTFGLMFLGLLVLTGTCLFFAGSRHQLKEIQREKEQLELEWGQLAAEKQQADMENERLRQARGAQELELRKLEQKARDTIKELESLVQREDQIRQELGLQQVSGETSPETQEPADSTNEHEAAQSQEPGPDEGGDVGSVSRTNSFHVTSTDLLADSAQDAANFQSIQAELAFLQNSLSEKTSQYDSYLNIITAKKEASAAEKARVEAVRKSIVSSALSYLGNPYVYGGNDPNTGVDCSGFTRYVLSRAAGVYLNRTAASQSAQGHSVSADNARMGDLVFYSSKGRIDHVAIYIGNGQVVHASNENVGIIRSNMYYRTPAKIVNVLGD